MDKKYRSLPDSELKVMTVIWKNKTKMSTGEILSNIKNETNWKLSTLQIILSRLVNKGFLKIEKIDRFNYYSSLIDPNKYKIYETKNFIKKMYNNSGKKLIASLIQDDEMLTDEDIAEIKKMLNKGED